ncbi:MAG: DEAD/DEAH box helicase family protein [Crocinitomicaceae bacterium]|nr:DEAD/DEAH box helicase family protein [Crocinitomicaceae bacterium]
MNFNFPPFESFIFNYTTQNSRSEAEVVAVRELELQEGQIKARLEDGTTYAVHINFNQKKVLNAACSCLYSQAGYCKHIIRALTYADGLLPKQSKEKRKQEVVPLIEIKKDKTGFTIEHQDLLQLSEEEIVSVSQGIQKNNTWGSRMDFREAKLGNHRIEAKIYQGYSDEWTVVIEQANGHLSLACTCYNPSKKLCAHIHFAIAEIRNTNELQLPFNDEQRFDFLRKYAAKMGLTNLGNPDDLFELKFDYGRIHVHPRYTLLSLTAYEKQELKRQLIPEFQFPKLNNAEKKEFVLVETSNYSKELVFTLMEAPLSKSGELKSPVEKVTLQEKMRQHTNQDELLFFSALMQQDVYGAKPFLYQDIVRNPLHFPFYFHANSWDTKRVNVKNLELITVQPGNPEATLFVRQSGDFYVLTCEVTIGHKTFQSKNIHLSGSFFRSAEKLFFVNNETVVQVLHFFKSKNHEIFIHRTQFESFREEFLNPLEQRITVSYSFVKKAPAKVIKERSLNQVSEHLIYLSESDDYILITPVICYGEVEVAVLSRRTVYTENPDGTLYSVERNEAAERKFLRSIQAQHPSFEAFPQTEFFYLHKQEFLDQGWFIDAFEEWRSNQYAILGFSQLKNNRYNAHKMNVQTQIISGIDWFDVKVNVSFGKQQAGLKEIQKSILNKTRFVQLGDGTQGILPQEWIEKFGHYFRSGEIKNDTIQVHKSNFKRIDELFEREVLSREAQLEIDQYKQKLENFHSIRKVQVPEKLNATLRDYQKEGLNWLHFLDEFSFGGCLADDMGLGKTIQIIAYFLTRHEKGNTRPNLVIVPTSLLFNWQREMDKFAPHLNYIALHGTNRETYTVDFNRYDVVLTTYGTLLSDVEELKKQRFDCLVLDESQAIKNPDSKRYKAVRLLDARQRLVVTGTPLENNTFDLYAQLSFAMPGLLGSAKRFAADYSTPIDKFQDTARAKELQQKIHPFVLRRTKKQVAAELPEKTEMVVYCEMDTEQRRVYDTYKIEFQKYLAGLSEEELQASGLHVLQGLTKLRQICNSPALLSDDEFYGDQSAKLDELMAQINNLKEAHKILVFSQFVGMLDLIKKRLDDHKIRYAYLTGQTKKREEQVEIFQTDETVRVFLISLKAGGTGLNLTRAEYVFLVDPWWNPAVENQAIDRAHRIGQTNKVVAVRLITPGTIEEKIMELQQRKRQLADELVHTDNSMLKQLSKEELMKLM